MFILTTPRSYSRVYPCGRRIQGEIPENSDKILENRDKILENRDKILENRDKILENRDKILENSDKILENRDKILENRDKILENRDKILENREIGTSKNCLSLTRYNSHFRQNLVSDKPMSNIFKVQKYLPDIFARGTF